jgi:carbonic anhydrase
MSCTAPLNIVRNLQTEKLCKLKCSYQFKYPPTNLQIRNGGHYLYFQPDEVAVPPVVYNDQNYNSHGFVIVQPSLHKFNGKHAQAELIIMHENATGTKQLMVCIPMKSSSTTTDTSAVFFDMIIDEIKRTAPSDGMNTKFTNSTFTLNKFIPMAPYFSYKGTNLFDSKCSKKSTVSELDYIVFHADNAITMGTSAFNSLKIVIPNTQYFGTAIEENKNPSGIFYNPSGPISQTQGGDIYIDCQPTGDDGEVLVPVRQETSGVLDSGIFKTLLNNGLMQIIIGIIVMISLWLLMIKVLKGITSKIVKPTIMPPRLSK